jgi:hypothetical protein
LDAEASIIRGDAEPHPQTGAACEEEGTLVRSGRSEYEDKGCLVAVTHSLTFTTTYMDASG